MLVVTCACVVLGDCGEVMYVVEEGLLDVFVHVWGAEEDQLSATLGAGTSFGEV